MVTSCERLCLYRKKINLSRSLAGQAVGVKEVESGIWLSALWITISVISTWRRNHCSPSTPLWPKCYLCLRNEVLPMCPVRTKSGMERETGFEPATSSLGSWHSTTELLPLESVFATWLKLKDLTTVVPVYTVHSLPHVWTPKRTACQTAGNLVPIRPVECCSHSGILNNHTIPKDRARFRQVPE